MNYQLKKISIPLRREKEEVLELLKKSEIDLDESIRNYFGVYDHNKLVASGGYSDNTIKSIAVDSDYQGTNVIAILMSKLVEELQAEGIFDIFVFTKPEAAKSFSHFNFHEIATTPKAVLLENNKRNLEKYKNNLAQLKVASSNNGAIIMNCNPFTKGHRFLIEEALKNCDHLYLFIVSTDKSVFPFKTRLRLLEEGTKDLENITIVKGGNYIISAATFPNYFLKEKSETASVQAEMDATIFTNHIATNLNIKTRFVGEEPSCKLTRMYNESLKKVLVRSNLSLNIIKRKEFEGNPISASEVRRAIKDNDLNKMKNLLYPTTYNFLVSENEEAKKIIEIIKNN